MNLTVFFLGVGIQMHIRFLRLSEVICLLYVEVHFQDWIFKVSHSTKEISFIPLEA